MVRFVASLCALVAVIGFTNAALTIPAFNRLGPGVIDEWSKHLGSISSNDSFGLAFGGDKLYLVTRRDESSARGGVVSMLSNGVWKHDKYDKLEGASEQLQDSLFTLAGRLFLLTNGAQDNKIVFDKLFAWDEAKANWTSLPLEMDDKDKIFQPLVRGPNKFISINVPDQEGKVAYVVATDHETTRNDSETSFSKLEVAFDSANPVNASLRFISRESMPKGNAVIASAVKDDILYAFSARFPEDVDAPANISIAYSIKLADKMREPVTVDESFIPAIDYAVNNSRIFQLKDLVIFLGKRDAINRQHRRVWSLNLASMKGQDTGATFPDFPSRIFVVDHNKTRLITADLTEGAFAVDILTDDSTKAPTTMAAPEGTKAPTTMAAPEGTKAPTTMAAPEGTKAPTTLAPEGTKAPTTMAAPEGTKAPTTVAPEGTKAPTTMAAPEGTKAPTTVAPEGTKAPTTMAPEATKIPTTIKAEGTKAPTTMASEGTKAPTTAAPL